MLTQLEILNSMLDVNGETQVTTVASQHPSVLSALSALNKEDIKLQSLGWWFNTDYALNLKPNTSKEIIVPSNTLGVELVSSQLQYVWRGTKLYDPNNHTYQFDGAVDVDLVTRLDIEELPTAAGIYLQASAIKTFYLNDDGDLEKVRMLDVDVLRAWSQLTQRERKVTKQNAKNSPHVARILQGIDMRGGKAYNPTYPGGG